MPTGPDSNRSASSLATSQRSGTSVRTGTSFRQSHRSDEATRAQARAKGTREPHDLYTFGHGGQGALGNGAFRDEALPYFVSSLREHGGVLLVACGFDHTVAVTGDLRARAWGRANEGQCGVEEAASSSSMLESPRGGR